jgi:putative ABC transport system permease protein
MRRTALAWKNLVTDWRRLALGLAGVAFAAILMFMQNGFRNALLDSPVQLLESLDADLVGLSVARYSLPIEQSIPMSLFNRAVSDRALAAATPVFIESARAQVRVSGNTRQPIRVVGIAPPQNEAKGWFTYTAIGDAFAKLVAPDSALLDRRTRSTYGFERDDVEAVKAQSVELVGKTLRIEGLVSIGSDFANNGTLLMTTQTFGNYFPDRARNTPTSRIDLALFKLRTDANPQTVAERLTALDPDVWRVTSRQSLIDQEIQFWNRQTPIGMIFFIGSLMGFAVGVIICYQILFNSIHDSLPEFATLKAMGYDNYFFVVLVIKQSLYLSLLGFVPALLVSWGLFELVQWAVGLPMLLNPYRILLVLSLTVVMCLISGLLALRRLLNADPANLF